MPTANETKLIEKFGWKFLYRPANHIPKRLLLLLQGWTGDENSMWSFARNLSSDYAIIAPRAPYLAPADKGGYSWREIKPGTWGSPTLDELHLAVDNLTNLTRFWLDTLKIASSKLDVVGFSQGGALALTLSVLYPELVNKAVVLSAFLPPGVDAILRPDLLSQVRFFWAHGNQDEVVPIERGLASIQLLKDAGAEVQFCESDVGHRVGKNCRRALSAFLNEA